MMRMRLETTPSHLEDPVARYAVLAERIGGGIALVLGAAAYFGVRWIPVSLHVGSGLLVLVGIVLAAVRLSRSESRTLLWVAAMVALVGAWVGLGQMSVPMHFLAMLAAVALMEWGVYLLASLDQTRR